MTKKFKDLVENCNALILEDMRTDIRNNPRKIGNTNVVSFWLNDDENVKMFVGLENSIVTFFRDKIIPTWSSMSTDQQDKMKIMLDNLEKIESLPRTIRR